MRAFLIQILNRYSKRIGLCEGSQVDVIHGFFSFPVVSQKPLFNVDFDCGPEVHKQQNKVWPK